MSIFFDMIPNRNEEKTMTTLNAKTENVLNHVKSSDFIKSELIALTNEKITHGKNALIFKAYLENKKSTKVELLISLGYDFASIANINSCDGTQLKNRLAKFKKAIEKEYLHKLATMFTSFVKEPTAKKLNSIIEFNSQNSGIVKAILKDELKNTIFNDSLSFEEKMASLPAFLTVNYAEKITPELSAVKNEDEPLDTIAPTIETNNFNAIRDYINNDADIVTLKLMQDLIALKLNTTTA